VKEPRILGTMDLRVAEARVTELRVAEARILVTKAKSEG